MYTKIWPTRLLQAAALALTVAACLASAAAAETVEFTTDSFISIVDTSYDGKDIVVRGCTVTIDGAHTFSSLTIERSASNVAGVVTHSAEFSEGGLNGMDLTITGDVFIQGAEESLVASRLDVSGKGSPSQTGPGAGADGATYGGGAGHGGLGASSLQVSGGLAYGSIVQPVDLGSGGGKGSTNLGGPGGGCVKMQVAGTLTVNGILSADGEAVSNTGGGGSGGSIRLTAGTLAGSGAISANGATPSSANAGSGGGGRIALYYGANSFGGVVSATGGTNRVGGAGTIYTRAEAASYGGLLVDNGGKSGALTPLTSPETFDLAIANSALAYAEAPLVVRDLSVTTGGILMHVPGQSSLDVTVQGSALIDALSTISVAGKGHTSEQGNGAGVSGSAYGGGAGYGGYGAASTSAAGGPAYGAILQPVDLGSGGGKGGSSLGGPGGGCVRLQVAGTLTVNGILSADGEAVTHTGGGGSGGSIWVTAGTLGGSGSISANGATPSSANAGSGAGGRIALYYGVNSFGGVISATGGINRVGGAGTIYARAEAASYGSLLVDNGGQAGALTPLTSPEPFNVSIANSASVYPTTALVVRDLTVTTGGILTHITGQAGLDVTVQGNALIGPAGSLTVAGKGFTSTLGPGAGASGATYGGGAGYGGNGASGVQAPGGAAYGSILQPVDLGSGGGIGSISAGGPGGGCVRLQVAGVLTVDGSIVADGTTVTTTGGGGSGGSIWVTAATLAGSGAISAHGATPPSGNAGSGAGGRIAIYYDAYTFSGTVSACGGDQRVGAPGTIYTKSTLQQVGDLRIDNGGRTGSLTALQFATRFNLTLSGGATAYPTEPLVLASLRVETGAELTHLPEQANMDVIVQGDAYVGPQGTITVTGKGFTSELGPGAGANGSTYGGGAGYGGTGGTSTTASGGSAYGSKEHPVDRGSGGGKGSISLGGKGGGAIRLRVNGYLTLDGVLSADGVQVSNTGGGGAGGSIWLTVGTLAGSGAITAAGGSPASANAGGGAGGRIAIYYGDMSAFPVSQISVAGGASGARKGEDGTIHLAQVEPPQIAEIADHYAVVGQPYRGPLPVIVNDAAGVQWDVVAGPAGMTIDRDTGEVFWAFPTSVGSPYTVTIQASNEGGSGSESWALTVIDHAKVAPDGIQLHFGGQVVTAAYPGFFYVEKDDRSSGIRVESAGHELVEGQRADVEGLTATNEDGERYIQAVRALQSNPPNDSGVIEPVGMVNRAVGGGGLLYDAGTGAGQKGVAGGTGVNNVGLLVRVWGVVTEIDPDPAPAWFTMDDGSGRQIRCTTAGGSPAINAGWLGQFLAVTGISTMEKVGDASVSRILLRSGEMPELD